MEDQEEKSNGDLDKKVKHISLSTLVITVIILLALIMVGIIIINYGNNEQFNIAKNDKKTNEEVEKKQEGMENKNEIVGEYTNEITGPTITKPLVQTLLGKEASNENQEVQDKNGNIIVIPAGFIVVPNGKDNVQYQDPTSPTVEDGIVITDKMENGEVTGNEFVWIPVEHPEEMYGIVQDVDGTEHYVGKLYDFYSNGSSKVITNENGTLKGDKLNWENVKENGINKTKTLNNGIIVDYITIKDNTGYREPDKLDDTNYGGDAVEGDAAQGIEQLKSIIGITTTENDEGETENKKILNKWKKQLQNEFDYLVASINKYKGFYIGRYETGNLVAIGTVESISTDVQNIPVVQRGRTDTENKNWYYMYQTSKNIASKNTDTRVQKSVTSSMIWGSQWDAVMNWFLKYENSKEYVINSKNKGNYSSSRLPTGQYQVKNIYDMAGNVFDWTIEAANNTINRVYRGGLYGFSGSIYPASSRRSAPPGVELYRDAGSRATLIINL